MRSGRERLLAAALLVLAFVLVVVLAPEEDRSAADLRLSTYRVSPHGARALYLTLEELGVAVDRRLTPFADADSPAGPLAVLAPSEALSPAELHALARWVEDGGSLLLVAGRRNEILDTLGLALTVTAEASARPLPHRWTEDVGVVRGFDRAFSDSSRVLRSGAAAPLLRTDAGAVVALTFRRGEGTVVAFSDPSPLANRMLQESGAALLFARAAAELAGEEGAVIVDEYHHGYRNGGSPVAATLRFLGDTSLGHGTIQLLVVGLGLLYLAGRRFGAPYPPPPAHRRSPLEHVSALAEVYRQAGARERARRLMLAGLARRLGRRAPHGPEDEGRLLSDLARRLPVGRERAVELQAEWRSGTTDLVALSRKIDSLLNEVKQT